MRKIFLSLLILTSFYSFAQDKRIIGSVKHETRNIKENGDVIKQIKNIKNYSVLLIKFDDFRIPEKEILKSKKSNFDIIVSENDLKTYDYIEFIGKEGSDMHQLTKITSDSLIVKLEPRIMVGKPAIYLYPEEKTSISIKNTFKGKVINTYPPYKNGWNVIAEKNGELLNLDDNRKYNYLFWDGTYNFTDEHFNYSNGFYVKKENNIKFLQEKLETLGLNNTEINDFIVYWLPELNKNEENFIHFWINDNIDNSSILDINPKPETLLRVFMEFKQYNGEVKLPTQELSKTLRKGFTVVEWGGSNIDEPILK